jgi:iron(III) transport system permease protein
LQAGLEVNGCSCARLTPDRISKDVLAAIGVNAHHSRFMSRGFSILIFAITSLFFAVFFIWPITMTVQNAFVGVDGRFTFDYVAEIFRNPVYLEGLSNSFWLAVASTVLTLLIAAPLAIISDRFDFPGKALFGGLILVPMILPPFVGAIGMKQMFGQAGALNALLMNCGVMDRANPVDWLGDGRFWGIVVMNALHLYPILYLNVLAALANVDPAMEEAATNLGCTGLRRFFRITLPLIMPGVFAGGVIVFIWAFTELGVPLMFDFNRVTSVQIFDGVKDIGGNPFPYALVAVLLVTTALLYLVSKLTFGRQNYAMMAKATHAAAPKKTRALGSVLCAGAFLAVTLVAILPHLGVVLVSFSRDWYGTVIPADLTLDHYRAALGHDLTVPSIANSLKYATLATLVDVVLGVAIAYVVVRTNLPGRQLLDAIAMLPLAVPGLVLAFGYLAITQEGRPLAMLNPTKDPTILLIIAYSVRRLPYVVRSAAAGYQQTSVTLEEAAQNLGASPLKSLWRVTLPLISANLIAGGLLAFSFAMLEVSDSLLLAQKQIHYPITKAIYELFQLLGDGRFIASALGVWAMAFLALSILAANTVVGKKLGAIFRV